VIFTATSRHTDDQRLTNSPTDDHDQSQGASIVNRADCPTHGVARQSIRGRLGLVWLAGLLVAVGAGVATAHGLYEVALAAGVPRMLAWLYPIITDGLALVAYATTTRLNQHGRRYAWTVVVAAAGLSGLTQAGYLAGGVKTAPAVLRFAIGAWPALAAAIVAHLLYLLGGNHPTNPVPEPDPASNPADHAPLATTSNPPRAAAPSSSAPGAATPHPAGPAPPPQSIPAPALPLTSGYLTAAFSASAHTPTAPASDIPPPLDPPAVPPTAASVVRRLNTTLNAAPSPKQHAEQRSESRRARPGRVYTTPAADRAVTVAREHLARHGRLPTVTELVTLARVARGTAATALQDLRRSPTRQQGEKPAHDASSGQ